LRFQKDAGESILLTEGVRSLGRFLWMSGARSVEVVRAETRSTAGRGNAEDFAKAYLYLDDFTAHLELSWQPGSSSAGDIDIVGSDGAIRVGIGCGAEVSTRYGTRRFVSYPEELNAPERAVAAARVEFEAFLNARSSEAPILPTLVDDRRAFEAASSIHRAAKEERLDR
jgi:predicted dehydrogenase